MDDKDLGIIILDAIAQAKTSLTHFEWQNFLRGRTSNHDLPQQHYGFLKELSEQEVNDAINALLQNNLLIQENHKLKLTEQGTIVVSSRSNTGVIYPNIYDPLKDPSNNFPVELLEKYYYLQAEKKRIENELDDVKVLALKTIKQEKILRIITPFFSIRHKTGTTTRYSKTKIEQYVPKEIIEKIRQISQQDYLQFTFRTRNLGTPKEYFECLKRHEHSEEQNKYWDEEEQNDQEEMDEEVKENEDLYKEANKYLNQY